VMSLERAVASNSGMGRTRTQKIAATVTRAMSDLARSDTCFQLVSGNFIKRFARGETVALDSGRPGHVLTFALASFWQPPKAFCDIA